MVAITIFQGKRIVLAVTGSIAVYKAVDLASKLTQAGALVDVIMSESAQQFVTALTFQAVTGRHVYTSLWEQGATGLPTHIAHVGLGEGADLMIVAPVTAHTIAKLANGLADDLLTVTALSIRCPMVIAPAMDGGMYEHPATQANLSILKQRGVIVIEPEEGRFASGLVGKGRLPETPTLMGEIRRVLAHDGLLAGKHVIVTAGGTREAIDPVRFVSNHSSGKQGYAIAQAALDAGAQVTLISTVDLPTPIGALLVKVDSAIAMRDAVLSACMDDRTHILIMAAAVADFRPAQVAEQKIKKRADDDSGLTIELVRNPDILLAIKQHREQTEKPAFVVGFAAESHDLLTYAQDKLARKGLDLIVANDISATDAGFASDNNRVVIIDRGGTQEAIELSSKVAISEHLIGRIAGFMH